MDLQTSTHTSAEMASDLAEKQSPVPKEQSVLLRILRNPLFLVIFTWVLMAFLLAFEVAGK